MKAKIPVVSVTACPTSIVSKISALASGCLATPSTPFIPTKPCPIPIPIAASMVSAAPMADYPNTNASGVIKLMITLLVIIVALSESSTLMLLYFNGRHGLE